MGGMGTVSGRFVTALVAAVATVGASLAAPPAAAASGHHRSARARVTTGEIAALRTRTSRTVRHADGKYTVTVYPYSVNYRSGGRWAPIDSTLRPVGNGGWRNGANRFAATFAPRATGDYLSFADGSQRFSFAAVGAQSGAGRADGSALTYPDAYRSTDLRYAIQPDGVEETIVLRDRAAPSDFRYTIRALSPGKLAVRRLRDGSWAVLQGPAPGQAFVLRAPHAADSPAPGKSVAPDPLGHATMTASVQGSTVSVDLHVDQAWLDAPQRHFPVMVDPTITVQPDTTDASFSTNYPNYSPYVSDRVYIGTDDTYVWRGALKFDLSSVPAGVTVTSATLGLYWDTYCITVSSGYCNASSQTVEAHRMTADWSASSTSSQLAYDSSVLSQVTVPYNAPSQWLGWNVTSTVQSWLTGSQPNYGFLMKRDTEPLGASGICPPSRTYAGSTSIQPKLDITYASDAVTLDQPDTVHSNGADLTWSAWNPPSGATFQSYQVHRGTTAGFTPSASTLLTTITDPSVTSYRDTTAAPNSTFTYKVVANSAVSNGATVTTPADGHAVKTLQPDSAQAADTYIYWASGMTNCATYGADTRIFVGADVGSIYRGLLRFPLGDIPAKASISKATLSLWQTYGEPNAVTVEAHRVTRDWASGSSGANGVYQCTGDGATWYDAAGGGVQWTNQGADYDSTVAASVAKPANQAPSFDNFDITSLAQQWADGSAANLGVLIKQNGESQTSGNYVVYSSSESTADPSLRPKLTVTYADGSHALPPTEALTAPGPSTVDGTVSLSGSASDDGAVDRVDFLVDGNVVSTDGTAPYTGSWDSTTASNGTHTIAVRATDNAGNTSTSSDTSVTVDNTPPPTVGVTAPAANATVSGAVTLSANATASSSVSQVQFLVDNQLVGTSTSTANPYTLTWNTLPGTAQSWDGTHTVIAQVTDSKGRTVSSSAESVTVANTSGTGYQARWGSYTAVPPTLDYDPSASSQQSTDLDVTVTNTSGNAWSAGSKSLNYRWYSTDPTPVVTTGTAVATTSKVAANKSTTLALSVTPPTLPDGVSSALYTLVVDMYDSSTSTWFADKGNPPITAQVVVTRKGAIGLGLEKYYQYDTQQLGAGMQSLVNVASGNMLLHLSPWNEPGRGLATVLGLTYNGLEAHSHSPIGNNWSLAISSLSRFGQPLDVHPNNADSISGRSDKWVGVIDGDGTLLVFNGTTNSDGSTTWTSPPGVHLYLRSTGSSNPDQYWALSRPDHTTFYYTQAGWPTSLVDKNGNAVTFTESATPAGEDPGGPAYRITSVTDAGGRSFGITYYAKSETKNAHQRGRIKDITDHAGHVLHFDYYEDGNLLRIVQRGGSTADGSYLADRSWTFTYLTSNGAGPAIPAAADRVDPDPHTPNEDAQIYSVRDPRGHETTYSYYLKSDGPALAGRAKTVTDRAGNATTYGYDTTAQTTSVVAPLSRRTVYTWDGSGRVTDIKDALGGHTGLTWTSDNELQKVTEPNGAVTTYSYNANGYLTDVTDPEGDRTALTYTNRPLDATDTGTHWSLLATKTAPNGTATTTSGDYEYDFSYDGAGNLTQVTDPLGYKTTYCYNLATAPPCNSANQSGAPGTLHSVTTPNGGTTTFTQYDANGFPQTIDDPLGRSRTLGFSADGLQLFEQDPVHASDSGSDIRAYRTYIDYDSFQRPARTSAPKSTSLQRGQLIWTDTTYDANDNVTAVEDAHYGAQDAEDGATTTTAYDAMDHPTLVTGPDKSADPAGTRTAMSYDAAGRLTSRTSPSGVKTGVAKDHTDYFSYDLLDRVTAETQYTVDGSGSVTDTRTTYNCFDSVGNLVTVTAPNAQLSSAPACPATATPHTTVYAYDKAHRRTSRTDPAGHQMSFGYDADGNVHTITDAAGHVTTNTYDQRDALVRTDEPYVDGGRSTTTEYAYDGDGNRTKLVTPRAYDSASDKSNITYYTTGYAYDLADELTRIGLPTAPAGSPDAVEAAYIHYGYDADGRLTSQSLPVTQSDAGQVATASKTVETLFDPGWIATSKSPATPKVDFDYTAQGWQTCRAPDTSGCAGGGADVRRWSYYLDGKVSSVSDEHGQQATFAYDADNNLTYAKTAEGLGAPGETPIETYVDYTGYDQVGATHYRKTGSSTYTGTAYKYDHDGNVTERDDNAQQTLASQTTNSSGVPITWSFTQTGNPDVNTMTYDSSDWLATQNDNGTGSSCSGRQRVQNTWTPQGWEATRTVSRADSSCNYALKQKTTWSYFDNGKLHTLTTTNGSGTVLETHTVGYETAGVYLDGNRASDAYALNGPGSTSCTGSSPTCTATYSYDARDRLYKYVDGHGGTTTYSFDQSNVADPSVRAGNITTQTGGPGGGFTATYTGNQITSRTVGGTTLNYWYDPLGRNTCVTTSAGNADSCKTGATGSTGVDASVVMSNVFDYLDRLTKSATYDAGTLHDSASYTYDALDRLSQETESHPTANVSRTTDFAYQGLTSLVASETDHNSGGSAGTDTKSYTYDAYGHRIALLDANTPSGGTTTMNRYTYGYDVHDSTSLLVDESTGSAKASYGYTPYGAADPTLTKGDTDTNSPINPYRYTGDRYDSGSKTLDMGSRHFTTDAQRFLQMDYYKGALDDVRLATDPLTQNRYGLGVGNPLSGIEYDGHMLVADGGGGSSSSPSPPPPSTSQPQVSSAPPSGHEIQSDREGSSLGSLIASIGQTTNELLGGLLDTLHKTAEHEARAASEAGRLLRTADDPAVASAAGRTLSQWGHNGGWARSLLGHASAVKWAGRGLVGVGFGLTVYDDRKKGEGWGESITRGAVSTGFAVGGSALVGGGCEFLSAGSLTPVCGALGIAAGHYAGELGNEAGGYVYRDAVVPAVDWAKGAYSTVSSFTSGAVKTAGDVFSDINPF